MKLIRITTVPFSIITLLKGQISYMREMGIDVKMISTPDKFARMVVEQEGSPLIGIPMSRKFTVIGDLISTTKLLFTFLREQPDIIHTNTAKAGLLSMLAGFLARVPIRIYSVGGFKFQSKRYSKWQERLMILVEKLIYRFATNVWPNNPSLLIEIENLGLTLPSKLKLIGEGSTNGVDLRVFSPESIDRVALEKTKQSIKYDHGAKYLLFVGRLCGDKGIVELVNVFERLQSASKGFRLLLVGPIEDFDDPLPSEVINKIDSNPEIVHISWADNIAEFMCLSHFFVFPSHREGLPNVIMQAGAMKLPVVCSNILGNRDLIKHEVTGVLFDKGNEDDFYEKLWAVVNGRYDIGKYSRNLADKIRESYDREIVQRLIYEEYIFLASKSHSH